MQEVVLDKGVKVLDCPGVVLDDFDRMGLALSDEDKGRRKGEVLLRNCVKVEEVDDPMAAVEEILRRVEEEKMREIYGVPEYKNITEFLVRVALTRGRLGKVSSVQCASP
jgi:nuclear GTP-binding protein